MERVLDGLGWHVASLVLGGWKHKRIAPAKLWYLWCKMCEHLREVVVDHAMFAKVPCNSTPSIIQCSEVISLGVLLSFNLSYLALLGGTIRLGQWICCLGICGIGLYRPIASYYCIYIYTDYCISLPYGCGSKLLGTQNAKSMHLNASKQSYPCVHVQTYHNIPRFALTILYMQSYQYR